MRKNVMIYVRSGILEDKGFIERQKEILCKYAVNKGYKIVYTIEDFALASQERKNGFKRVLKILSDNEKRKRKRVDVFLVFNEEAIGIVDTSVFKHYLASKGIKLEVYLKDYHGRAEEIAAELMYIIQKRIKLLGIKGKKKKQILNLCFNLLLLMKSNEKK